MDTLQSYREKLHSFALQVPQLLSRHPETIEAAQLIRRHIDALENPRCFRVAVTGKIKQGKSTIICALIGRSLPTVGVNETTATLNFINHGAGADLQRIRVHWKDNLKPDEEYPLEFLTKFQGAEGKALAEFIQGISIFSNAEFLRNVQLIDCPGEMGTQLNEIDIKADALIRVLPFVAEANDQRHLGKFGGESRPFGSGAYNSVAVIQKWEELWPNENGDPFSFDPFENALKRAIEQQTELGDAVSEVIPVSGLLALFSKVADKTNLENILEMVQSASKDDLKSMLKKESYLTEEPYQSVPLELRQQIFHRLKESLSYQHAAAWPALKMAVWAAHRYSPTNAEELANRLYTMSNIDSLNDILKKRFFALSELIQTGSGLNKVIRLCESAVYSLNSKCEKYPLNEGKESLRALETIATDNFEAKQEIQSYIKKMQEITKKEVLWIEDTRMHVSKMKTEIEKDFDLIQREISYLHTIDSLDDTGNGNCLCEARRIFGQFGFEVHQRLNCDENTSLQIMKTRSWELLNRWRTMENTLLTHDIQKTLVERLNSILDILDNELKRRTKD